MYFFSCKIYNYLKFKQVIFLQTYFSLLNININEKVKQRKIFLIVIKYVIEKI